jgi:2'-5' RNA ligase
MDTLRTFIAVELTPPILDELADLQARMVEDVPAGLVRWVRPAGIHLTLKFLGEVPVGQVDAIAAAMREACAPHGPFRLSIQGLGCFPNARRPRVVWVGVDEPTGVLIALQRDVERALRPLGFRPEGRQFSPHLTLARVKGRDRDAVEALGEYVGRARVRVGEMAVAAVHLMRSELLPGGAVYTALAVAPLSGTPAP